MRRLVVISNSSKKSKAILALVAVVFLLTSIHLAAAARIETLKQQQEQFEQASLNMARAFLTQSSTPKSSAFQLQSAAASRSQVQSLAADLQIAVAQANPQSTEISPATIEGTKARNRQIVISIADRQLAVMDSGQVLKIYPIAVGAGVSPSPDGDFLIINHAKDPIYRHGEKEIAPGKDNPLGSRWMGLSLKGYGIHGTNVQSSVGKAVSHGCFRMRKHDVEELYGLMQVGDKVTVRREHDAMIAHVFDAPATTLAATNMLAAKTQRGSQEQIASASETATVETTEQ